MKIKLRIRRSTKQYIIVAMICFLVIGGAAVGTVIVVASQIKDEYQILLEEANNNITENQRTVYIATKDIIPGEKITEDTLALRQVYSSQPKELYITREDIGKVALIHIPQEAQLLQTMVTEHKLTEEVREVEFDVVYLGLNVDPSDRVDIRVVYPNGENYIVLSNKEVKDLSEDRITSYLWLSEEEIQLMSSAVVDAYLYKGTKIYTSKYIEPSLQSPSVVTYTPSLALIDLIKNNPNIVTLASEYLSDVVRKEVENRLALYETQDVTKAQWKIDKQGDSLDYENSNYYYKEEEEEREVAIEYGQ